MAKKKITLSNLSDMTPEDLLNEFPYSEENKKHLQKIFNDTENYDDEDYFDECYKVAKKQLEQEERERKLTELRNAIAKANENGLLSIYDAEENDYEIDWIYGGSDGVRIKITKL